MKMNKLKKFPVVQLMPLNMLLEIEAEVEIDSDNDANIGNRLLQKTSK